MSVEAMEGSIRSGGLYFSPVHRFTAPMSIPIDTRCNEIILEPHMVGPTTDLAMTRFGTCISSLAVYRLPHFGLRASEQRLWLAGLGGRTDRDIPKRSRPRFLLRKMT